jgi:RND family efflux transporter MFP subunit
LTYPMEICLTGYLATNPNFALKMTKRENKMFRNRICGCQLALAMLLSINSCQHNQQPAEQTPTLAVMTVTGSSNNFKETFPATIKGKQDIDIRPQVSGFITKVLVDEGAQVRKGQVLFEIDPVQYQQAVNVAKAAVAVARTAVSTAQLTASNKASLAARKVISDYEKSVADNQLAQAKSQLAQAQASLVAAQKNLSYTKVVSPSNGVVGKIEFRAGALVSPSTPQAMTTVSENDHIYANFAMTEKKMLELSNTHRNQNAIINNLPAVELQMADGSIYPQKGKVATISGVIDQETGSVNVRAEFANSKGLLRSGGACNILIPHTLAHGITIPQNATYEIQDKRFAYKVDKSNKLSATVIEVYPLNNGKNYVVTAGLKEGDRILTEGVASVHDGQSINIRK